jgi:hypothetical protein
MSRTISVLNVLLAVTIEHEKGETPVVTAADVVTNSGDHMVLESAIVEQKVVAEPGI